MRGALLSGLLLAAPLAGEPPSPVPGGQAGTQFSVSNDLVVQQNQLATWSQSGPVAGAGSPWRQYQESMAISGSGTWSGGESLVGGVTVRSLNFYQQSADETLSPAKSQLYRKYLKYTDGGFSVQGGNYYAQLGRGLVLSVLPVDPLLEERTIEGGELRLQKAWVEVRALAGRIETENLDQAWRVVGGEVVLNWLHSTSGGVHSVACHGARISDLTTAATAGFDQSLMRDRTLASASVEGNGVGRTFGYYAETAHLAWERKPEDLVPLPNGRAVYGLLTWHPGPCFFMGEYRQYLGFLTDLINPQNSLNNPPLADRDNEKNNLTHSDALRLLSQVSCHSPDLTFFASVGRIRENGVSDPSARGFAFNPVTDVGHNVYGGFTAEDLFDRLTLGGTYGVENIFYAERRTDASANLRLSKHWNLEVKARDLHYRMPVGDSPYRESDLQFQVSCSPWLALYGMTQYRTDAGLLFRQNRFNSGGVRLYLGKGSYLDLSGGAIRGGLVCSGGQCREMPDFKGWKAATHFVF